MKDAAGLIIAIVALAQPWLIYAYRTFVQKAYRDVFPIGEIELGHSSFGSTLTLGGTLLARNKSQVVRYFEARVTRVDQTDRPVELWWFLYRDSNVSGSIAKGIQNQISFRPRQAIYLKPEEPQRFEVFFISRQAAEELQRMMVGVRLEWANLSEVERSEAVASGFKKFLEKPAAKAFSNAFQHVLLWRAGTYNVELTLKVTGNRAKPSSYSFQFSVSPEEEASLLSNIPNLLGEVLTNQLSQYQFVYKEYPEGMVR